MKVQEETAIKLLNQLEVENGSREI